METLQHAPGGNNPGLTPGRVAALENQGGILFFENFDFRDKKEWMANNWAMSIGIILGYLALINIGKWLMKERKPMQLRNALTFWNIALAIFSIAATVRTLPELIKILNQDNGLHHSVCYPW
jgi:hypothetical protein